MSFHGPEHVNGWRLGEVLLSEDRIAERVRALADDISRTYTGLPLTVVSILKGSYIFLADLTRALSIPVQVDFCGVSSYVGTESGETTLTTHLTTDIEGHHVLVVEDIVDTGRTLSRMLPYLQGHRPASIRVCALLDKPGRREVAVQVDFAGFTIDNRFVVGYGLDLDGWYRQLPYIAGLERVVPGSGE